jgi:hypothetical protein
MVDTALLLMIMGVGGAVTVKSIIAAAVEAELFAKIVIANLPGCINLPVIDAVVELVC